MLFSYVSRLVNSLLPGEAAKASMEMKRWNRMIPSFWGFDIPYFHHHLHRTPRLERPSAPEMPTNQCYKGRKCSPPLAPQRSASIQRGREEDYTPENYNNMLAINDSKPSWLYNMPKKTHLLSSKPSSSDELGKWCGPLAELHGRFFFSPFRVSWIPSIFFSERTTSFGVTNMEVDSDPKLPGACFACKWQTMAKNVRSASPDMQRTVKQHIQMIQLCQNYGGKKRLLWFSGKHGCFIQAEKEKYKWMIVDVWKRFNKCG